MAVLAQAYNLYDYQVFFHTWGSLPTPMSDHKPFPRQVVVGGR